MRHEKTIIIRNPYLKKLRDNLRRLYWKRYLPTASDYYGYDPSDERQIMTQKNYPIFIGSICKCNSCLRMNRDMIYNKPEGIWYCLECYTYIKARNKRLKGMPLTQSQVRIFLNKLGTSEGFQYDGNEWSFEGKGFINTRKILSQMGIPKNDQEKFINFCKFYLGYSDSDILNKVVPYLTGRRKKEI